MTIWKFPLQFPADVQTILMPRRSEIVTCPNSGWRADIMGHRRPLRNLPNTATGSHLWNGPRLYQKQHAALSYIGTVSNGRWGTRLACFSWRAL